MWNLCVIPRIFEYEQESAASFQRKKKQDINNVIRFRVKVNGVKLARGGICSLNKGHEDNFQLIFSR